MEIQRQAPVLRTHLLKMTMLSQRAVDYSIKAYELGNEELYQLAHHSDHEWHEVQQSIGNRGRALVAAGTPIDADSLIACCMLRVYSGLRVTYTAAAEIAQNAMMIVDRKRSAQYSNLLEMGRFANNLVRLCTVAIFKREIQHAKTIVQNRAGRQRFDLLMSNTVDFLKHRRCAHAGFELAIAKSLGQIAEQAYEIAEALALCVDCESPIGVTLRRAA